MGPFSGERGRRNKRTVAGVGDARVCRLRMLDKRTENYGSQTEWRTFLKIAAILRLIASCPSWFHMTSRVSGSPSSCLGLLREATFKYHNNRDLVFHSCRREQVFAEGRLKLQVCGILWRENEIGGSEGRIRTGWEKGKLAVVAGQQRASEPYPLHQYRHREFIFSRRINLILQRNVVMDRRNHTKQWPNPSRRNSKEKKPITVQSPTPKCPMITAYFDRRLKRRSSSCLMTCSGFGHNLDVVVLKLPEFILLASGCEVEGTERKHLWGLVLLLPAPLRGVEAGGTLGTSPVKRWLEY
ncbi:hypothetical protein D9C73_022835 [Collichthys lucidus]|uniref:Uncharacterized protein n=1 Tax=Collichthys lucidus TaxID=240159 RepID=A0A4U5VK21_COLLU|nr:hypothetical protein D9C73_022835 [Collichthys lucidus]